jgi:hypothetical protein
MYLGAPRRCIFDMGSLGTNQDSPDQSNGHREPPGVMGKHLLPGNSTGMCITYAPC